jgi:4-hydroxy-3-methylbut-2-enyl diphosphate reductase IspH
VKLVLSSGVLSWTTDEKELHIMEHVEEVQSRTALHRLRCVQQITEADEETLQIVSAVLERSLPAAKTERKKRGRAARPDAQKGGDA